MGINEVIFELLRRFYIMEYGYVRVSSKDQNIARQMAAMHEVRDR